MPVINGNLPSTFLVATQDFETGTSDAYVIIGNAALLKCEIPSFVSDFVSVINWVDNQGDEYFSSSNSYGSVFLNFLF